MHLKKINEGYSVITVIYILTFIMTLLTLATFFVSFYLHLSSLNLKKSSGWEPFYKILKDIKEQYFEITIKEEYTSPYSGWFSDIPETIEDFKIEVSAEDSKLDINHIDTSLFFKNAKGKISIENINLDFNNKKTYLYYTFELDELIKDNDKEKKILLDDYFTIYNVPSLNSVEPGKMRFFLESRNISSAAISSIENALKSARGNAGASYLKYRGSKLINSGLLVNKSVYESLKNFTFSDDQSLYMLLDYKGQINLNFVNEKVFEICVKACALPDADYKEFWSKIKSKRDANDAVKESDIDAIFGYSYVNIGRESERVRNWLYFEKIFSVDSALFKVIISKNNKKLTGYFRRYKDKDVKVKILKISAEDINGKKDNKKKS